MLANTTQGTPGTGTAQAATINTTELCKVYEHNRTEILHGNILSLRHKYLYAVVLKVIA